MLVLRRENITETFCNGSFWSLSKHDTDDKIILVIDHAQVNVLFMARSNRQPLTVKMNLSMEQPMSRLSMRGAWVCAAAQYCCLLLEGSSHSSQTVRYRMFFWATQGKRQQLCSSS